MSEIEWIKKPVVQWRDHADLFFGPVVHNDPGWIKGGFGKLAKFDDMHGDTDEEGEAVAMANAARAAECWNACLEMNDPSTEIKELKATRAECERLREALQPFANISGEGDEDYADDAQVTITFGRTTNYTVKLGDLRRAASALFLYD